MKGFVLKTRNWLIVFYPDSCGDWRSFFDDALIRAAVSPLHDRDVTSDGEFKKPHYHAILCFDGPKSYESIVSLVEPLGITTAKPCNSLSAAFQYLYHGNNPDKAQYLPDEVSLFGGFNPVELFDKSSSLLSLLDAIRSNYLVRFCDVVSYCIDENPALISTLSRNSYLVKSYCDSLARPV